MVRQYIGLNQSTLVQVFTISRLQVCHENQAIIAPSADRLLDCPHAWGKVGAPSLFAPSPELIQISLNPFIVGDFPTVRPGQTAHPGGGQHEELAPNPSEKVSNVTLSFLSLCAQPNLHPPVWPKKRTWVWYFWIDYLKMRLLLLARSRIGACAIAAIQATTRPAFDLFLMRVDNSCDLGDKTRRSACSGDWKPNHTDVFNKCKNPLPRLDRSGSTRYG